MITRFLAWLDAHNDDVWGDDDLMGWVNSIGDTRSGAS